MKLPGIDQVRAAFIPLRQEVEDLFAEQWRDPELPAMEFRSSARLASFLARHGFDIERQAGGLPTAFVARKKRAKGPVIALLAEYDALPGLAAAAESSFTPLSANAGHGCGHNHIGPANAAAAILAAQIAEQERLAGEIRVIGCPAEELLWGKIALLHAGVFEDVDVLLTSHGDYQTGSLSRPCQSVVSGEFVFTGKAGHGGFSSSANALQAAEAFVLAAECKVNELLPQVGLRHVLRRAGVMPGITPDEARVWYTTRHVDFDQAKRAYALLCETAAEVGKSRRLPVREQFISETRGYLPNDVLGKLLQHCALDCGPPDWSKADTAFMAALAKSCAPNETFKLEQDIGYFDEGQDYYGQDDGDLSWRIPLGRVNWAYPTQVPIHHWAWTALSGHAASFPGCHPLWRRLFLLYGLLPPFHAPRLPHGHPLDLRDDA